MNKNICTQFWGEKIGAGAELIHFRRWRGKKERGGGSTFLFSLKYSTKKVVRPGWEVYEK